MFPSTCLIIMSTHNNLQFMNVFYWINSNVNKLHLFSFMVSHNKAMDKILKYALTLHHLQLCKESKTQLLHYATTCGVHRLFEVIDRKFLLPQWLDIFHSYMYTCQLSFLWWEVRGLKKQQDVLQSVHTKNIETTCIHHKKAKHASEFSKTHMSIVNCALLQKLKQMISKKLKYTV